MCLLLVVSATLSPDVALGLSKENGMPTKRPGNHSRAPPLFCEELYVSFLQTTPRRAPRIATMARATAY